MSGISRAKEVSRALSSLASALTVGGAALPGARANTHAGARGIRL